MLCKLWLQAARLKTLPLALSSIGMGGFLAIFYGQFDPLLTTLSAIMAICLQILSNFANDYGDTMHGADTIGRIGPQRVMQTGLISHQQMKKAIIIWALLSSFSGLLLLYCAFGLAAIQSMLLFCLIGAMAITAAITYTVGKRPYGYVGLGDVSVLIFFGWVGVLGTCYLQTQQWVWEYILPASSCGFFTVAVLNVNNLRDIASDAKAGKLSIPVRLGKTNAIYYHWFLLTTGMAAMVIFSVLYSYTCLTCLAVVPLLIQNGMAVQKQKAAALDPYLKQMVMATLIFVLLFGIGVALHHLCFETVSLKSL